MILLLFAYALIASTYTIGWVIMQHSQPFFTIGFRMVLAGVLLLGYLYFFDCEKLRIARRDWQLFIQAMIFQILFAYVAEFHAFATVTGAKSALLYNMSPFIAALLSYILLKEKMNLKKWLGFGIGFVGFLPILIAEVPVEAQSTHLFFFSFAEIEIILSVISATYGWILVKKLMQKKYSIITVNGVAMLGGGLMSMACSLMFETWQPLPITTSFWHFFVLIVALIIVGNIICYNIFGLALRRYSTAFMVFVGFVTPLFAALYDWIFFSKVVPMAFFATLAMVSVGLYIFYQEELRHIHEQ